MLSIEKHEADVSNRNKPYQSLIEHILHRVFTNTEKTFKFRGNKAIGIRVICGNQIPGIFKIPGISIWCNQSLEANCTPSVLERFLNA